MSKPLDLALDRAARTPLAEQIRKAVAAGIADGALAPGARLPSWQGLAAQLGVARGTVQAAYGKLAAAQLVEASRTRGTRVALRARAGAKPDLPAEDGSFINAYREMTHGPGLFQMGVPAADTFPATLVSRLRARAIRAEASAPALYPDPRGELELRREIAGHVAVSRGIACAPSQVFVTGGFSAGLGLALRVLRLEGQTAWFEEPGFPWSRKGLELAGLSLAPIPVDARGIDIDHGLRHHPGARLVLVTPGQQAPLGVTLALERRLGLLGWAAASGAWIIEDDYLGELQIPGRAAPSLASLDRGAQVIHIGSFSKTISPALRLGFLIVPGALVSRFAEVAACLAPAPGPATQIATAEFMREGHYIRHLRRTKRAYAAKQRALLDYWESALGADQAVAAGLAVLLKLPTGTPDLAIAREAFAFDMAPAPLSPWYARPDAAEAGLLLGVATAPMTGLARSCDRLLGVIERFADRGKGCSARR